MPHDWVSDVLTFWFDEANPDYWFKAHPELDAQCRARFADLHQRLSEDPPREIPETPDEALATVIVLDQFSRNLYRDSPRAFASDAAALHIAKGAIERGHHRHIEPALRVFLYMPFQHSEDRETQARSVELFEELGDPETLDYARRHRDIVERFGRFPHRNAVLGRETTPEEAEFLRTFDGF